MLECIGGKFRYSKQNYVGMQSRNLFYKSCVQRFKYDGSFHCGHGRIKITLSQDVKKGHSKPSGWKDYSGHRSSNETIN